MIMETVGDDYDYDKPLPCHTLKRTETVRISEHSRKREKVLLSSPSTRLKETEVIN